MTVLFIRTLMVVIILATLSGVVTITLYGTKDNHDEIRTRGIRDKIVRGAFSILSTLMLLNLGMVATKKDKSVDYTEYLGENYYRNYDFSKKKMFSSYVANHSAPCDIWILMATLQTELCMVGAKFVRHIPFAGWLSSVLQTLYVDRGQEGKGGAIESIENRQKVIEEEGNIPPLLVFAEGTTQNNEYLLPLKKGVFSALKSIVPIVIHYDVSGCEIYPFVETCEDSYMITLRACTFSLCNVTVNVLPAFQPNNFLFETHADKGEEKWQIYAWAIRDIMLKNSHLKADDQTVRVKVAY